LEIYLKIKKFQDISKTEALTQAFRKSIGIRIKEETEVCKALYCNKINLKKFSGPKR